MKRIITVSLFVMSSIGFAAPQVDKALSLLEDWESQCSVGQLSYTVSKVGSAQSDQPSKQDSPTSDLLVHLEFDGVREREASRPWKKTEKASDQKFTYRLRGADGVKFYTGYTLDPVMRLQADSRLYLTEAQEYVPSINPRNLLCRMEGRLHSDWLKEASRKPGFSISESVASLKLEGEDVGNGRRVLEIAAITGKPTRLVYIGADPDSITLEYRWFPSDDGKNVVEFRAFNTKDEKQLLNHLRMMILEEKYGEVDQSAFAFAKAPVGSVFYDEVSETLFQVAKDGKREKIDRSAKTEANQEAVPFGWLFMVGLVGVGGALLIFLKRKFGNAN